MTTGYKQFKGFTLAEVLITLGVIGVIAALTIPTLVNNSRKSELRSRFQKANAIVNIAVTQLVNDNNITNLQEEYCYQLDDTCKSGSWIGLLTTEKLASDMAPYLKTSFASYTWGEDVSAWDKRTAIYNIVGGTSFAPTYWYSNAGSIYLPDGSFIDIVAPSNAWPQIAYDTNGNKGPNRFGYDIFWWVLQGTKAVPTSWNYGDGQNCQLTDAGYSGVTCAQYAIKDQCPWDDTKGYWQCLP